MGVLDDFADFATRNADEEPGPSSTYADSISQDTWDAWAEENPEQAEQFEASSEDFENREFLEAETVTGDSWGGATAANTWVYNQATPDWMNTDGDGSAPPVIEAVGVLVFLAILAYAFGQLFDIQVPLGGG